MFRSAAKPSLQHVPSGKLREAKSRGQMNGDQFVPGFHWVFRRGSSADGAALFTRMSIEPNSAMVFSKSAVHELGSAKSAEK